MEFCLVWLSIVIFFFCCMIQWFSHGFLVYFISYFHKLSCRHLIHNFWPFKKASLVNFHQILWFVLYPTLSATILLNRLIQYFCSFFSPSTRLYICKWLQVNDIISALLQSSGTSPLSQASWYIVLSHSTLSSGSSSAAEDERLKSDIVFQSEWEIARKLREIRQRLSALRSQNVKQKLMAIKVGLH